MGEPDGGDAGRGSGADAGGDVTVLVEQLAAAGLTVAVAESLTAGLVCARLADVPGASRVLRGGAVVYATDTKASVLGVDAALLATRGPVDADVAAGLARGVRRVWGADIGLATTGVAGPDPQGGAPPGTVFVAVAGDPPDAVVRRLRLSGDRAAIRAASCQAALELLAEHLHAAEHGAGPQR